MPKVEELQMDWLRSEDLKEEKIVTASDSIIAVKKRLPPPGAKASKLQNCWFVARPCVFVSIVSSSFWEDFSLFACSPHIPVIVAREQNRG